MGCVSRNTQAGVCHQVIGARSGTELLAEASPLTVDSEDEAFLSPAGHVQHHARVCA